MTWLQGLIAIGGVAGAVPAIIGVLRYLEARSVGELRVRAKMAEAAASRGKERAEVDRQVRGESADAIECELRKHDRGT